MKPLALQKRQALVELIVAKLASPD